MPNMASDFEPQFNHWLAANHRQLDRGTDSPIRDRVRLMLPETLTASRLNACSKRRASFSLT